MVATVVARNANEAMVVICVISAEWRKPVCVC
jgi:hypothetical protein